MPKAGTRRVQVDGRQVYIAADEAEMHELITDGCRLQQQVNHYTEKLKLVKERLAELAEARRGAKATVHLRGLDGRKAVISWPKVTKVDPVRAETLRGPLGPSWDKLFQTRIAYTMAKGYQKFMQVPQGECDRHKADIGAAFQVVERAPSCKFYDVAEPAEAARAS